MNTDATIELRKVVVVLLSALDKTLERVLSVQINQLAI